MRPLVQLNRKTRLLLALLSVAGSAVATDCFWLQLGPTCGDPSTSGTPSCPSCETKTFTPGVNTYCVQTSGFGLTQWSQARVQQTIDFKMYPINRNDSGICTSCGTDVLYELTGPTPYYCDQCTLSGDLCWGA